MADSHRIWEVTHSSSRRASLLMCAHAPLLKERDFFSSLSPSLCLSLSLWCVSSVWGGVWRVSALAAVFFLSLQHKGPRIETGEWWWGWFSADAYSTKNCGLSERWTISGKIRPMVRWTQRRLETIRWTSWRQRVSLSLGRRDCTN